MAVESWPTFFRSTCAVEYLQSSLNKEAGGRVAINLEYFYEQLRVNLAKAQFSVSQRILSQQITDLLALREAWSEVERAEAANPNPKLGSLMVRTESPASPGVAEWEG
jgi:flagellin-specific chaperone FliS